MKNKRFRVAVCVLAALVAVVVVLQLVLRPSTAYETEVAGAATVDDRLEYAGTVVKSTTVVAKPKAGIVCYVVSDGARVAKGQTLGYLYTTEAEAQTRLEINRIDTYIALLTGAGKNAALVNTQYETLTNQMNKAVVSLLQDITAGDYASMDTCEKDYIPASARREIAVNAKTSFQATISAYQAQRDKLEAQISKNALAVTAPVAGYFSRGGLVCVKPTEASSVNLSRLTALAKQQEPDVVGVISSDYTWQFVGAVDAQRVGDLKAGNAAALDFGQTEGTRLPATIVDVRTDTTDTSRVLVQVRCNYMDPQVAGIGCATAGLILNTYEGIRVSRSALRFQDSVPGVYVKGQRQMQFKKVNILYENDSIMICEMNTDDSDFLRLYDEVIVKGADLYDGKPV